MTPDFATPDDDLIDVIAAVALTAAAMVVGTVLGTGLVVGAVRRRDQVRLGLAATERHGAHAPR